MPVPRFLVIAGPAVVLAAGFAVLAELVDAPAFFIVALGFLVVAIAAWYALADDLVMAGLVVAGFLVLVGIGIINTV